nr:Myb domain-containing transcription factor [Hapsidospora chrysogena]
MPSSGPDQPAKKQSKWSPEEDALIIELRGSGMKWEDISKHLPGRSAISCRLHYQNYLERRSEWSEERKDKLAQLYERFKADMWAKVAEELAVPWRAAEAMHWQLGEQDMARRAGVVPFSLAAVNAEANAAGRRNSPSRSQLSQSHLQAQRHGSVPREPREMSAPPPRTLYGRQHRQHQQQQQQQQPPPGRPGAQAAGSRRETMPPPSRPTMPPEQGDLTYIPMPTLAPIQSQGPPTGGHLLPSIAELTTGVAPYSGAQAGPPPGHGNVTGPGAYHGVYVPAGAAYAATGSPRVKRPASPEEAYGEPSHRRRMG